MQRLSALILCLCVTALGAQEDKPAQEIQLDELLRVDDESVRKDEFARCKAMAARYGSSVRLRLTKEISRLHSYCNLTEKQWRRLELATRGSTSTTGKRFLEEVEATASIKDDKAARKKLQAIRTEMQSLLSSPATSSFWTKAVSSTLTAAQTAELEKNMAARQAFAKRAWVFRIVDETDAEILLLIEHRERLLKLFEGWIAENPIPATKRGRRGPWRMLPESVVVSLIFPELDETRARSLIAIAPHHLRQQLSKRRELEAGSP